MEHSKDDDFKIDKGIDIYVDMNESKDVNITEGNSNNHNENYNNPSNNLESINSVKNPNDSFEVKGNIELNERDKRGIQVNNDHYKDYKANIEKSNNVDETINSLDEDITKTLVKNYIFKILLINSLGKRHEKNNSKIRMCYYSKV